MNDAELPGRTGLQNRFAALVDERLTDFARKWRAAVASPADAAFVHAVRVAARRLLASLAAADIFSSRHRAAAERLMGVAHQELDRFQGLRDLQVLAATLLPGPPLAKGERLVGQALRRAIHKAIRQIKQVDVAEFNKHIRSGRRLTRSWLREAGIGHIDVKQYVADRAATAAKRLKRARVKKPASAHRARVALKRLRYACEIADALCALELSAELAALRGLQNEFGLYQDREVALGWLDGLRDRSSEAPVLKQLRKRARRDLANSQERLPDLLRQAERLVRRLRKQFA